MVSIDICRSNPKANIVLSAKKLRLKRKRLSRIEQAKSQMDIEGFTYNTLLSFTISYSDGSYLLISMGSEIKDIKVNLTF